MNQNDIDALKTNIQSTWDQEPGAKAKRYIGRFFDRIRTGKKIVAKVEGNYRGSPRLAGVKKKKVDLALQCSP